MTPDDDRLRQRAFKQPPQLNSPTAPFSGPVAEIERLDGGRVGRWRGPGFE